MIKKGDVVLIPVKILEVRLKGATVILPNGDKLFVDKYYETYYVDKNETENKI